MNAAINSNILVPPTYGTPFQGGFYGGQIRVGEALFAVAWAPKATGEISAAWLDSYTDVPDAISTFDSAANTAAMAAAGSALAQQAIAADINGYKDWLVPARDVLELGYRHLKPTTEGNACSFRDGDNPSSAPAGHLYTEVFPAQTQAADFQEGGAEAFEDTWYWSSTQYGEDLAYYQYFDDGSQNNYFKEAKGRCRFVRLIPLNTSTLQSFEPIGTAAAAPKATSTPPRIGEQWVGQGGIYCGIARGEDGAQDHHLILAQTESADRLSWSECQDFGKTIVVDGHTDFSPPLRFESALLYANVRDKIDTSEWYWTGTQCGENSAYHQGFGLGFQDDYDLKAKGRCRFVRRLPL